MKRSTRRPRRPYDDHIVVGIGLDPSLTGTGISALQFTLGTRGRYRVTEPWPGRLVAPDPELSLTTRLSEIVDGVEAYLTYIGERTAAYDVVWVVGIEGFSRGSRFRREEAGMAHAAALIGVGRSGMTVSQTVTPLDVKKVACPLWPGYSKANWVANGYTRKFKRSMPGKVSVQRGLERRFGIKIENDNVSDAACVAIAAVAASGRPISAKREEV